MIKHSHLQVFVFFALILGLSIVPDIFAQDTVKWKTIDKKQRGFTVRMPKETKRSRSKFSKFFVEDTYSFEKDGAVLSLTDVIKSDDFDRVPDYVEWSLEFEPKCSVNDDPTVFQVKCSFTDSFFDYRYLLARTSDRSFELLVYAPEGKSKDILDTFIDSFKVTRSALAFESNKRSNLDDRNKIRSILAKRNTTKRNSFTAKSLYTRVFQQQREMGSAPAGTRPLTFLLKPRPGYTYAARSTNTTGQVRVRALFGADGSLAELTILSAVPFGLTEKAANALTRIEFEPAVRNGKRYSVRKTLVFNFRIY